MPNSIKILVIGDIIGKGARNAFISYMPVLKERYNYDIISVNAENATHGRGMNYKHYKQFNDSGVNVMTMGNHVLDNKEIYGYIGKTDNLVVPGNVKYESDAFKDHLKTTINFKGYKISFINLLGQFNSKKLEASDPLAYFDSVYKEDEIFVVDYHAELTMEKNLLGYYTDGRASLVYGTHTHVQTADERILPNGTAYITDLGMCGSVDSVIGYDYQSFLDKIKKQTATYVSVRLPLMINGLFAEIDLDSKKALKVERINIRL